MTARDTASTPCRHLGCPFKIVYESLSHGEDDAAAQNPNHNFRNHRANNNLDLSIPIFQLTTLGEVFPLITYKTFQTPF